MVGSVLKPGVSGRLHRYWWLFLIRGLCGLALGVFALVYPGATLAVAIFAWPGLSILSLALLVGYWASSRALSRSSRPSVCAPM
jgi:uncharacterized membrane protein HdeD (DUF308 family)